MIVTVGQGSPQQDFALWSGQSATGFFTLVRSVRNKIWRTLVYVRLQQDLAHSGQVSPKQDLALWLGQSATGPSHSG